MTTLSVVLGTAGTLLLLVGLVGGGFTFSGSMMPPVGKIARIPCFVVGTGLVFLALVLALWEVPPSPHPDDPNQFVATGRDEPDPAVATDAVVATGVGVIAYPTYSYDQPQLSANYVGEFDAGLEVEIMCTVRGESVTLNGNTSNLWDYVGTGFIPDVAVYTGTVEAVASPC